MVDKVGTWLPLAEVARLRGVSRQAISKQVRRLVEQGLVATQPGRAGSLLVNVAELDRAIGDTTDLAHVAGNATRKGVGGSGGTDDGGSASSVYTAEQARLAGYRADMAQLDLDERLGKLIPIAQLERASQRVAERLVLAIDRLPSRADEVAAMVAKEGTIGARGALKTIARDLRRLLADELAGLAGVQPDDEAGAEEREDNFV